MRRPAEAFAIVLLALAAGCAANAPREVDVGHHRLRLVVPQGWERLHHGGQQLFRSGEAALVLEDWGAATPDGLAAELQSARSLWRSGRRQDALTRVRELHGPPLDALEPPARADFWKPWTDAIATAGPLDTVVVGGALDALVEQANELPEVSSAQLVRYVVSRAHDADRRELARVEQRSIHGREWSVLETQERASHLSPRRMACLENGGFLLVLDTQGGPIEQTGPAFDELLASIEVLPQK